MPKKIRELKTLLLRSGFSGKSGKGSHTKLYHPLLDGIVALTDGHIFFDTVATSCHNSRRSYVKASNS